MESFLNIKRRHGIALAASALLSFGLVSGSQAQKIQSSSSGTNAQIQAYEDGIRAFGSSSNGASAYRSAVRQRDAMVGANQGSGTGGGARSFAAANPSVLGGVAKSPFAASQWQFIGPTNLAVAQIFPTKDPSPFNQSESGRVNGLAYDPSNKGVVYLAADSGGIWKSTNNGLTWNPLTDNAAAFGLLDTTSIAVDPTNGNILYAGTGDYDGSRTRSATGIVKSTDGGKTWANSTIKTPSPLAGAPVKAIVVDQLNPLIVTAVTGRGSAAGSLWRSTDGGATFTAAMDGKKNPLPTGNWSDLKIGIMDVAGAQIYYATREGDGLYTSTDGGATWQAVGLPNPAFNSIPGLGTYGLRVAPSQVDAQTVYLLDASQVYNDGRIFQSTDAGKTWIDITGNYPTATWAHADYATQLTAAGLMANGVATDLLYAQSRYIAASDAIPQWTNLTFGGVGDPPLQLSFHHHNIAVNPFNQNQTIIATDGGIFGLSYGTTTQAWSFAAGLHLNDTLGVNEFLSADWHPTNPDYVLGASKDNGLPISFGDLGNWGNVSRSFADNDRVIPSGLSVAIDQSNPSNQYVCLPDSAYFFPVPPKKMSIMRTLMAGKT